MTSSTPRPFIIPVFIPNMGCPHQCAFCNQKTITGIKSDLPSAKDLQKIISEFLSYKGKDRGQTYIAFYGGNFMGLEPAQMEALLSEASKYVKDGQVTGIRMSTRPDTITDETLAIIKNYPVFTIELGVQSMDDRVLKASMRGHRAFDTVEAVKRLKEAGYEIGLQMMVGLPEDSETRSLETAAQIADLSPDFVRIYPTVVLKNSLLARWYQQGTYEPMDLDSCVNLVKKIYLLFKENNIRVIRMGLQETEDLASDASILAGPYHPSFGHLVYSEIFLDAAIGLIEAKNSFGESITLKVRPENISMMRGLKNKNVEILKNRFNFKSIEIIPDVTMNGQRLVVV
ncbi:MAG: radical SAM protein [Desulfobacterales bacterium]|nr:radical SAM protein [Desulfobacterales bacterium]